MVVEGVKKVKKYNFQEYGLGIKIKPTKTLLPKDRRKRPYPTIRKLGLENITTWEEYHLALIEKVKEEFEKRMEREITRMLEELKNENR